MSNAQRVVHLLQAVSGASCRCPAHSRLSQSLASSSTNAPLADYAFEMACSSIRFGDGVTQEVGQDLSNMKVKKVAVFTDKHIVKLQPMQTAIDSLTKNNVDFEVFDRVVIEPTDLSFKEAISWAKQGNFDSYLAVGGGSVIDTCKAANLYASNPGADFLDYVNLPYGKGKPIENPVKPLIAVPTTAGTGSETTGIAIFDFTAVKAKTGIRYRAIRPLLGLVDPLNVGTMPRQVATYSAFDVFCHALESYTALPYLARTPRPSNPINRPAYQGSNPISDVWAMQALRMCKTHMIDSILSPDNKEARRNMLLASTFAGIGFGNAGTHLCHGLSYGISGHVKSYQSKGYPDYKPLIPHGLSVVITAPAVFSFTAPSCPQRHLDAAQALGYDTSNAKLADSGRILSDVIREYCYRLGIDNGLSALGYQAMDLPLLVDSAIPNESARKLTPRSQTTDDLYCILEKSLTLY